MIKYQVQYQDDFRTIKTQIINDYRENGTMSCLYLTIDDVTFQAMEFDDFEVAVDRIKAEQLEKFSLIKIKNNWDDSYSYMLQNYKIMVTIPVVVVRKIDDVEIFAQLVFNHKLRPKNEQEHMAKLTVDGKEIYPNITQKEEFYLQMDEQKFTSYTSDIDFENNLLAIFKQIKPDYYFKNCFGCLYADYHPVGNGWFGSMLCFKKAPEKYLAVKNKSDFFAIDKCSIQVQETYCCDSFKPRSSDDIGYRGGI